MNDRREHRKLRLCSNKCYQPKARKRRLAKEESLLVSVPLNNIIIPFKVSLPLSSYTNGTVASVHLLQNRLECCGFLPLGIIFLYFCCSMLRLLLGWTTIMQNTELFIHLIVAQKSLDQLLLKKTSLGVYIIKDSQ